MVWKRFYHYLRYCTAASLAVLGLAASEHHGAVKFNGLPVPGATVTAVQGEKKLVAVTDGQGAYAFPELADGIWTIQVEMLCFTTLKQEVGIAPGAPSPDWELKLQPFDAIRAIAAAAPPPSMPPAPVRAPDAAGAKPAETTAAAPPKANKPGSRPKGSPAVPANGASGFQRTGLNASSAPAEGAPKEAPADMAAAAPADNASDVLTINGSSNNGAASRFGQSPAFGNFRRGPGWLYHGSFAGTLDNSALDAAQFSVTGQPIPKPGVNKFRGTAMFQGPLIIPHLIPARQNNIQFNLSYTWARNRTANNQSTLMPTPAERGGDFSQVVNALGQPQVITDPTTGQPFPNNVIPQNRISPQANALLGFYPQPNFASTRYNFQAPLVTANDVDAVSGRLSKTLNNKNSVFGNFGYQRSNTNNPNLFDFVDTTELSGLSINATWSHRVSNRLFTTLNYTFSRSSSRATPYFANRENVSGEAGITGNDQTPGNWGPPTLSFASGIQTLSDNQQSFTRNQSSAISFNTSWNHTPHNFQFGGDFRRLQLNSLSQQNGRGGFQFTGGQTGSDFADFLLGLPDTSSIAFGNADKYFRESVYDVYVNDDWRATPSFTLNYGLRWDYGAPTTELYGRLVNLDVTSGFGAALPVLGSSPTGPLTRNQYPSSLVRPDKHEFAPKVGFSWRPISGSSMVVRGGYSLTYNTSVYQSIANQMAQQSPLSKTLSIQNSAANPLTLASGFNAPPGLTNTFGIDPDFRVGYVHTWQLSIQEDLPAAMILNATYLGIKGTRAAQEFYPNSYPAGSVSNPCPACPSGFVYMTSNGNSTREAGTLQLRRRLHNGFTATMIYTYSKSIDDASLGGQGAQALVAQNWLDLSAERGLSSFDQRHLLTLQTQYTTGVGVKGGTLLSGWRGLLIKEWTVTSQLTLGSGLPITPMIPSVTIPGTGFTSVRPEYTGASLYDAPPGLFLNPLAYTAAPSGFWGNAGRNSITGPSQFGLIASMQRTFRLRDRINADLRFDSTNALNHVTFTSWNALVGTSQFGGLPGSAAAMRAIQATFRVRF